MSRGLKEPFADWLAELQERLERASNSLDGLMEAIKNKCCFRKTKANSSSSFSRQEKRSPFAIWSKIANGDAAFATDRFRIAK